MPRIVKVFRRPPAVRMPDRNGGFPRLSDGPMLVDGAHGFRCPSIAAPGGRGGAPRIYRVGGTPPVAPRRAPGPKPWEPVARGPYHGPLV